MIEVLTLDNDWVHMSGKWRELADFRHCIARHIHQESLQMGRGRISIEKSAIPAVAGCLREFGVDVSSFADIIEKFKINEEARKEAMKIVNEKIVSGIPVEWDFLNKHQKIAVSAMTQDNLLGLCLFDEQGTGKTLMALAAFDILRKKGQVERMIVTAPKSVLNSWDKDVRKIPGDVSISIVSGNPKQKDKALRELADIIALSYDTLASNISLPRMFARRGKCLLVVDESQMVKNPKAQRYDAVRELRKTCVRAFVLSGTPSPRHPEDLVHQSNIIDNGHAFQGYNPTSILEEDAAVVFEILSERGAYIRRTKRDVLPLLPPKKMNVVKVEMFGRQRNVYEKARDDLVLHVKSMNNEIFKKNLANYFVRRANLLQICGCPSMADPMFPDTHAKLIKLDELVNNIVAKNAKKLVIWSSYTKSIEEIASRYKHFGLVKIDGSSSDGERKNSIESFQNDPAIKIFLGNPAAAGAGITLHSAADNVYVSYTDKAADFIQSIDRTHRIGQNADSVRYYFLVCDNTIEVHQLKLLQKKVVTQHLVFGEDAKWPETIEDALNELSNE